MYQLDVYCKCLNVLSFGTVRDRATKEKEKKRLRKEINFQFIPVLRRIYTFKILKYILKV